MSELSSEIKTSLNSALKKLTSYKRRAYAAELCITFYGGSARKMERSLQVSRAMVELGLHEKRSGFQCIEAFSSRGAKKKKAKTSI